MKRRVALVWMVVVWLLVPWMAWSASEGVNLQDGATSDVDGGEVLVTDANSIGLDVTISGTATVTFQIRGYSGGTYTNLQCTNRADGSGSTTTTASGHYQCNVAGGYQVKAPISGCSSCTVSVKGQVSTAVSSLGGTGAVTGWPTSSSNKEITWANSEANCLRIGDGTSYGCFWWDATDGWRFTTNPIGDLRLYIPTNKNYELYDQEGVEVVETVDPDAASTLAMWTYGAAYRPKKSVWLDAGAASVDGTQCATPTESANTLVKTWTIVCADHDSGAIYWKLGMPDAWDGGTVTFELQIHQVGASTNAIQLDFAAMCYSHDEAVSAFATPPTGEQPADITLTADNDILHGTTAAVTVAGTTCAGGDTLFVTGQVDATASHADIATAVEILGAKMEYSITSRSD